MPLITCPDCNQSISDQAPACIHCGRPMVLRTSSGVSAATPRLIGPVSDAHRYWETESDRGFETEEFGPSSVSISENSILITDSKSGMHRIDTSEISGVKLNAPSGGWFGSKKWLLQLNTRHARYDQHCYYMSDMDEHIIKEVYSFVQSKMRR